MITFSIIGGGWRTPFFLKLMEELPDRFRVAGMLVRDAAKGAAITQRWGVPTFTHLDDLLRADKPSFVVTSVPWAINPGMIAECVERGLPVLSETPPAPTVEALNELYQRVGKTGKVQIAEQYPFQPLHAARLQLARSGKLGTVTQAQVSIAHGYHGIVLMRRFLNVGFEPVSIRARNFTAPLVEGPGRAGPPTEEKIKDDTQLMAQFDFASGKLGSFDFTGAQYFSYIRGNRLLVRGERGEIDNSTARWLLDFKTPMQANFERQDAGYSGNLEGLYHKGYTLGGEWVYRNPFTPARLTDDEIAVGECVVKMHEYANGGDPYYPLADGCHDHYLYLLMQQSAAEGRPVQTEPQAWSG